jgi:hypothetical protein
VIVARSQPGKPEHLPTGELRNARKARTSQQAIPFRAAGAEI